jgi:hypothetical protein
LKLKLLRRNHGSPEIGMISGNVHGPIRAKLTSSRAIETVKPDVNMSEVQKLRPTSDQADPEIELQSGTAAIRLLSEASA